MRLELFIGEYLYLIKYILTIMDVTLLYMPMGMSYHPEIVLC